MKSRIPTEEFVLLDFNTFSGVQQFLAQIRRERCLPIHEKFS